MPPANQPTSSGSSGSSADRRRGRRQIPAWYYAAGAAGLAILYFFYSRNKAAQAAAAGQTASGATGAATPVPAGSYGNAGDIAALLPYLQMNQAGTGGQTGGSGVGPIPAGQVPMGQGFQPGGAGNTGAAGQSVTGIDGHTYSWISGAQEAPLIAAGQTLYFQATPGYFLPVPPNTALPNTALYVRTS